MGTLTASRRMAAWFATLALGAGALVAVAPPHAGAALACRSDPLVVLNNGVVLDLSAAINDDVTDVRQITYTLHVPAGVSAAAVVTTDGEVKYHEQFILQQDSVVADAGAPYTMEVSVATRTPGVTATGYLLGGTADAVGITPSMVGLSAWVTSGNGGPGPGNGGPGPKPGHGGGSHLLSLPSSMNAMLVSWIASTQWPASAATATAVTSPAQPLTATITL